MKIISKKSSPGIISFLSRWRKSIVIFLLTAILLGGAGIYLRQQDTIYLAVAGPTDGDNISGIEMVRGAQLYLDRVNQQGGIGGKKVALLVFDDLNNSRTASKVATKIVKDTPALAVLGHLYSSTSIAAGKIYQQFGIPAISGSATAEGVTAGNDWYFRTIFNNPLQASSIANYAKQILNYDRASIIYSDDDYGKTLKEAFSNTFNNLGGKIEQRWAIDSNRQDFKGQQAQIIENLSADNKSNSEIIFCATHNSDIVELIVEMKRQKLNYPLIGSDSLADVTFARKFEEYREEKETPGYFSNGIYAISPIIFDVANEKAQKFRNQYIQTYQEEPGWTAATYYDAAAIAVAAMQKAGVTGNKENLIAEREKIKTALTNINRPENSLPSISGNLSFDGNGDTNGSIYIGNFYRQKFISAFTQLQPIENVTEISNLEQKLRSGKVLLVDGNYVYKTNIVYTGIDINEIRNLDEKASSYLVDFYLWFRFQGDIPADDIEFTNYSTDRMDSGDKLELDEPIDERTIEGVTYRLYRIKADFKEKFYFNNYPFDKQKLAVRFRHKNLTRNDLIYVVDVIGMRDTVATEVTSNWQKSQVFATITDWKVTQVDFFQDSLINDSTLGNPELFNTDGELQYSRFNTAIAIKRDTVSFTIKNLLPLLFFVGISYLILFLPFDAISVEAVSGTLLAIVFFHLSLLEGLPEGIGYVVALDYGFYVIYSLIGLELLLVVIGNKPEIRNNKVAISRLILTARIVFPIILAISAIALFIGYGV